MGDLGTASILLLLVLLASMLSVELGLSVAIIEIAFGVVAGNFLGVSTTPWIEFIAAFAGVVLTFLAGAEVDPALFRRRFKESVLIGAASFLLPLAAAGLFAYYVAGWDLRQSQIAGIALSTTSLAVVYAVLVETGLTGSEIGKTIMAATFVTDFGTAAALSILFIEPTPYLVLFAAVSVAIVVSMFALQRWFFGRYGGRIIEPEIKGAFFALFLLMWTADLARSHAILPAFVLGLVLAPAFKRSPEQQKRFRVVAFSFLTPIFFFKSGLSVNLGALASSLPLFAGFLGVKIAAKFAGVLPLALRYLRPHATYTTLLMSTGLTFGTISSLYGLSAGIIDQGQFSVLVTTVMLSAILPTAVAQRFFSPPVHVLSAEEREIVEDEEFEPGR